MTAQRRCCCSAAGAGRSALSGARAVRVRRDLRQPARARTTRTRRAPTCSRRRAGSTGWARPRSGRTCSPSCSSARACRSSSASRPRSISAVLGAAVGLTGGYFGGWTDSGLDAFENWFLVIPQLPLMIVLARLLEPVAVRADRRDRAHELGRHRADRARAGADAAGARVRGARAGARRERRAHRPPHILPNTLPLIFANTVLIVAVAILVRGGAVVPRARRPDAASRGGRCSRTASTRARRAPGRGGTSSRRGCASPCSCSPSALLGYLFEEHVNPRLRERRVSALLEVEDSRSPPRQADRRRRRLTLQPGEALGLAGESGCGRRRRRWR